MFFLSLNKSCFKPSKALNLEALDWTFLSSKVGACFEQRIGVLKIYYKISVNSQIPVIQMFSQYYNSSVFEPIAESKISAQKRTEQIISPDEAKIFRDSFPYESAMGSSQRCDFLFIYLKFLCFPPPPPIYLLGRLSNFKKVQQRNKIRNNGMIFFYLRVQNQQVWFLPKFLPVPFK